MLEMALVRGTRLEYSVTVLSCRTGAELKPKEQQYCCCTAYYERVGHFLLSQRYFLLSEYTYSTVFYPYSTHFPKLTVFYRIHQERTRIHKNTSMWKSVSAIFCESARIPQNTDRIPRRVGILQEFRIPLKNTAQNTQKNTVFFIVFRIRPIIRYPTCRIPLYSEVKRIWGQKRNVRPAFQT